MKKNFLLSILALVVPILGLTLAWAADVVTGNGSEGTIDVSDINDGAAWTQLEAGEAWTLDIEVKSDGSSKNEWGSSILASGSNAFPEKNAFKGFQLYLQSSTNGGKLNAVFGGSDHVINNVSYNENFKATIVYDGDKALSIKTVSAAGTEDTQNYTLTTAFPAISQFAYGLPTGINITKLVVTKTATPEGPQDPQDPQEPGAWATMKNDAQGEWTNVSGGQNLGAIKLTAGSNVQTLVEPDLTAWIENMPVVTEQVILAPNTEYTITWTENDNLKYTYIRAYLDKNKNYSFADEGELLGTVGTEGAQNGNNKSGSITFTTPTLDTPLETRLRIRVDGAWYNGNKPSQVAPDANTNRIVYDIPVKIKEAQLVDITYNYIHQGQTIATGTQQAIVGEAYPQPQKEFMVDSKYLQFTLPEGEVPATPAVRDVTVELKENFPFEPTSLSGGALAPSTKYYIMTLRGAYGKYDGTKIATVAQADGTDAYLFAFVGDPAAGYKMYNKDLGTDEVVYTPNPSGTDDTAVALTAVAQAGTWGICENSNGGFCLYEVKDDGSKVYLNQRGGAFAFWNDAKSLSDAGSNAVIEEALDYTVTISTPQGFTAESRLSYASQTASNGGTIVASKNLTIDDLTATEVSGYSYAITLSGTTITVTYTAVTPQANPQAICDLLDRIGGRGTSSLIETEIDRSLNSLSDVFVIGAKNGKPYIKGTTPSALTAGIGWYLNHHAKVNIAWNSLNEKTTGQAYADLSNLPVPTAEEIHTCDARYRYYLNYCTFGYSMTTWTWKRWQQEIDWMALHGINMPLQIIGLEEVWRKFLTLENEGTRKYHYTDQEAKAFVAGPAFTAWWGMNNLEGWGGTSADGWGGVQDDAWYTRQATLASQILSRQRELGMQPVLPGFSGMVPHDFTTKTGVATDNNGGNWCGFVRPYIIDPTDERFADIAKDYYDCLNDVMGESQYYSMDPFHEGGSISSGKYTEAYKAVYDAMEAARSGSQWVIQQWQWNGNQKKSINAVPQGKLIVLDLFSDGSPAFDSYNGYAPQHSVFCAIPNFGGRSGVMGRLQNVTDNYFKFKAKYPSIKGIGAAPEAIEQTPVTYDLIFELCWMNGVKPDITAWVDDYATIRYGSDNATAKAAWQLLSQSVLAYGADGIQGPVEDVWAARPNLEASPASTWGVTINNASGTYTKAKRQMLIDATYKLLSISDELNLASGSTNKSNYSYDLVEFGGAVLADYAYDLLRGIKAAKEAAGKEFADDDTYKARRDLFLALIADVDALKGTNLNFRLGKWTQEARDAAAEVEGVTTATPDWYEFNNARTLITIWGDKGQNGVLKDYSYRSWQGLLKDYYLPRWQYYFDNGCQGCDYFYFEWNWAHGMTHNVGDATKSTTRLSQGDAGYSYSRTPEGDTHSKATELLDKYLLPVTLSDGTVHYAYRALDNDLTETLAITAASGTTLDLTTHFGSLSEATLTSDCIQGTVTDLANVTIKSGDLTGTYTATLTLADGTKLTFTITFPEYNGVYTISYNNSGTDAPLFIAYNEVEDNGKNKGYKLIAEGTYTTEAAGDKYFTIVPKGAGYAISAQGKHLKQPYVSGWQHVMFSDDATEAGIYVMEADGDYVKIKSTASGKNYLNAYDKLIFGNDLANKENLSTFKITQASTYPLTVTEAGMATLCLPFDVILPDDVVAYDLTLSDVDKNGTNGVYSCTIKSIAKSGDVLKADTPVIISAPAGDNHFGITTSSQGAKTSLAGSLLKGNFVSQTLTQGTNTKKYIFTKPDGGEAGFYRMSDTGGTIGANKCWMEWTTPQGSEEARAFVLVQDNETGINAVAATSAANAPVYDMSGQRLPQPRKGANIISGKVVIVNKP